MSQETLILNHLKRGQSISPIQALNDYGCFRLGARICDLKKKGYNIKTETIHNNHKHFAKYSLHIKTDLFSSPHTI